MANGTTINPGSTATSLLDAQASQLLQRNRGVIAGGNQLSENAKIDKSSKDFESILLGSWLQQAEKSFASVPGGDEEADQDAGKDQFQAIAMQALAGSLTASGGIGIARMIAQHLHKAATPSEQSVKTSDVMAVATK